MVKRNLFYLYRVFRPLSRWALCNKRLKKCYMTRISSFLSDSYRVAILEYTTNHSLQVCIVHLLDFRCTQQLIPVKALCYSNREFSYSPYFNQQNAQIKIQQNRTQNALHITYQLLHVSAPSGSLLKAKHHKSNTYFRCQSPYVTS
jgi:hypothetical protein